MAFVFSYFNVVFAKPLYPEMPSTRSQACNQHSQGQDSQPLSDVTKPEESISQESNNTSDGSKFLESPIAYDRIARNTHPCVSRVVREFDSCRNSWVDEVQCKRHHPACSYVVSTHGIPKCQSVYGFRNATFVTKCPSIPIYCQCAVWKRKRSLLQQILQTSMALGNLEINYYFDNRTMQINDFNVTLIIFFQETDKKPL